MRIRRLLVTLALFGALAAATPATVALATPAPTGTCFLCNTSCRVPAVLPATAKYPYGAGGPYASRTVALATCAAGMANDRRRYGADALDAMPTPR